MFDPFPLQVCFEYSTLKLCILSNYKIKLNLIIPKITLKIRTKKSFKLSEAVS